MTKAQLIELINRRFQNRWHPNIVSYYIDMALKKVMFIPQRKVGSGGQAISQDTSNYDFLIKEFEVDVEYDSDKNVYYIDYPVRPMQLGKIGDSIRSIDPIKEYSNGENKKIIFTPVTSNQKKVLKDLEVFELQDRIRYIVFNDRVEFIGKNGVNTFGKLRLSIVVPFESLDEDDDISIPNGMDIDVVEMVYKLLQNKPFDDIVNDTNEKTK